MFIICSLAAWVTFTFSVTTFTFYIILYNCSSFAVWQRGSLPCQPRIFQWDFSTCRHFPHQVFSSPTPTPPFDWHCFEPPSSILMNECHEVFLILIVFTCSLAFTITWQFAQFVLLIQVMKISVYLSSHLTMLMFIMLRICSPLPNLDSWFSWTQIK